MKKIFLTLAAVGCCAFVAQQAQAVTGTISFSGTASATRQSASGKTTTVNFTNPWSTNAGNSGDYSAVPSGVSTTMSSITFTGTGTGAVLSGPSAGGVNPQWTFTFGGRTYSFNLGTLIDAVTTGTTISMAGEGTATISGPGGTDTSAASWSIDGTGSKMTFSATIHTTATPDGGSAVALLGIALAGVEAVRRKVLARKA